MLELMHEPRKNWNSFILRWINDVVAIFLFKMIKSLSETLPLYVDIHRDPLRLPLDMLFRPLVSGLATVSRSSARNKNFMNAVRRESSDLIKLLTCLLNTLDTTLIGLPVFFTCEVIRIIDFHIYRRMTFTYFVTVYIRDFIRCRKM